MTRLRHIPRNTCKNYRLLVAGGTLARGTPVDRHVEVLGWSYLGMTQATRHIFMCAIENEIRVLGVVEPRRLPVDAGVADRAFVGPLSLVELPRVDIFMARSATNRRRSKLDVFKAWSTVRPAVTICASDRLMGSCQCKFSAVMIELQQS